MIELILLGMLYEGHLMTGYDLRKCMARSVEFFQSNSLGSIQPGLKKLEKQGLLTSSAEVENGRKKHYYQITPEGRLFFDKEFRLPFKPDRIRCNQLVKMFFFETLTPDERLDSTDHYLDQVRQVQAELKAVEDQFQRYLTSEAYKNRDSDAELFQMDTLQFGLEYYQFMEDWFTRYKILLVDREKEAVK